MFCVSLPLRADSYFEGAWKRHAMSEDITPDQVVDAARELDQDEFTRGDVAQKLGVQRPEMKKGFNQARKAGRLTKTRDDEENTGHFRLSD